MVDFDKLGLTADFLANTAHDKYGIPSKYECIADWLDKGDPIIDWKRLVLVDNLNDLSEANEDDLKELLKIENITIPIEYEDDVNEFIADAIIHCFGNIFTAEWKATQEQYNKFLNLADCIIELD